VYRGKGVAAAFFLIGVNTRSHQSAASHENEPGEYYPSRDEDEEEEEEINNHGPFV